MSEINYSVIQVGGDDAFDFLQAQLATSISDIPAAEQGDIGTRSTWCNPKGRVICIPSVSRTGGGYALSLPSDLAETVMQRMTMFRFRSKVDFAIEAGAAKDDAARLAWLRDGIPEIERAQSEKFTPHMLNLDLLGLVSLDKGCYPGQEIVARTHYRGASKRRLRRFQSAAPVRAGDKVSDGSRDIGEVVNAIGTDLLAVVPVDADQDSLSVNSVPLTACELPYPAGH